MADETTGVIEPVAEATPNVFDDLLEVESPTTEGSPTPEQEPAKAPAGEEINAGDQAKPEEGVKIVPDDKDWESRDPGTYARFAETNGKLSEYKEVFKDPEEARQIINLLQDPDKLESLAKTLRPTVTEPEAVQADPVDEIDQKISELDPFDPDYGKNIVALNKERDKAFEDRIEKKFEQRELAKEIEDTEIAKVDTRFAEYFKDRPPEERDAAWKLAENWANDNPGKSFPFKGDEALKIIDIAANHKPGSEYDRGRDEANRAIEQKILVAEPGTALPDGTTSAGGRFDDILNYDG